MLGTDGAPIQVMSDNIRADNYGQISYADGSGAVGRLGVFTFPDTAQLVKNESGLFGTGGQQPTLANEPVLWGYVENSNVDMIQEMSRMMTAQRAYSYALRMVTTADEVETTINNLAN